jgi:hypothetical protein
MIPKKELANRQRGEDDAFFGHRGLRQINEAIEMYEELGTYRGIPAYIESSSEPW